MNTDERKAGLDRMRAYIAQLQPLMRLQQWLIDVDDEPPRDPDRAAECIRKYRQWWARIAYSDEQLAAPPEELRLTTIHELLHLVTTAEYVAGREAIEGLNSIAQTWAQDRFDNEYERATDHLSRIIAPFLPLPPAEASQEGA